MKKPVKFSPEFRERAVRMVTESRCDHPSLWSAVESIAAKIGCTAQTLHEWVRKHEVDTGMRDGVTSEVRDRIKALEREVKESNQVAERFRNQVKSLPKTTEAERLVIQRVGKICFGMPLLTTGRANVRSPV